MSGERQQRTSRVCHSHETCPDRPARCGPDASANLPADHTAKAIHPSSERGALSGARLIAASRAPSALGLFVIVFAVAGPTGETQASGCHDHRPLASKAVLSMPNGLSCETCFPIKPGNSRCALPKQANGAPTIAGFGVELIPICEDLPQRAPTSGGASPWQYNRLPPSWQRVK